MRQGILAECCDDGRFVHAAKRDQVHQIVVGFDHPLIAAQPIREVAHPFNFLLLGLMISHAAASSA
ncbi:hypothetical protein D3C72_2358230 [compost metagenome]